MQLLIDVSTPDAATALVGLLAACRRRGTDCAVFFTNDGVQLLDMSAVAASLRWTSAAVACEHSWHRFMGDHACPVTLGSQTDHSRMAGQAAKIITL